MQKIYSGLDSYKNIDRLIDEIGTKKFMLVCGNSFKRTDIYRHIENLDCPHIVFSDFISNPLYEEVCNGVNIFKDNGCDTIIAVGGGSAIDVAKCIKMFINMDDKVNYLEQDYKEAKTPFIAMPTTAGTGSESTRFAVIYYEGVKKSVSHLSLVPNYVILEPELLRTLPRYQRICTLLDAFCQAAESWWSVNSTKESIEFSKKAIKMIIDNAETYVGGSIDTDVLTNILRASNYAGQAINITTTTAPHAMSYKITSTYHVPHGLAVAVTFPNVWEFMIHHMNQCADSRGREYVQAVFEDIARALGASDVLDAIDSFRKKLSNAGVELPHYVSEKELRVLASTVNTARLSNNPMTLSQDDCYEIYKESLK